MQRRLARTWTPVLPLHLSLSTLTDHRFADLLEKQLAALTTGQRVSAKKCHIANLVECVPADRPYCQSADLISFLTSLNRTLLTWLITSLGSRSTQAMDPAHTDARFSIP